MKLTPEQLKGQHTSGGIPTVEVKNADGEVYRVNEHEYDPKVHGELVADADESKSTSRRRKSAE